MLALMRRRPLFLVLMMIVSMCLSGCDAGSFDLSGLFGKIADVATKIGPKIGEWVGKGVDVVKNVVTKAKDFIEPILEKGKEIAGKVKDGIDKVKDVAAKVKDGLDKVKDVGNKIQDGLGDKLKGIAEKTTDAMGEVADKAKNVVERVADPASEFAKVVDKSREALEKGVDATTKIVDKVKDTTENFSERISDTAKELVDNTKDVSSFIKDLKMPDANKADFTKRLAEVQKNFESIAKDAASKPADVIKGAFEDAKKQYETILDGLNKYKDAATNTVNGVTDVVNAVKDNVDKTSDKVKDTIAVLSADYQAAIDDRTEDVKEQIAKLTEQREAAKTELTKVLTSALEKMKERQEAAKEVNQALADLKDARSTQIKAMEKALFQGTAEKAENIASIKASIAKESAASKAKIEKLQSMLNNKMLKIFMSDKRRSEIKIMIAEEEMRSSSQIKKLEEALAVSREAYKNVSVAEQKKILEAARASINKNFNEQEAKLRDRLTLKDAEFKAAEAEYGKAKVQAAEKYAKIKAEYQEKIDQKNKQIAELKASLEAAKKKALDDAKRIEDALKK